MAVVAWYHDGIVNVNDKPTTIPIMKAMTVTLLITMSITMTITVTGEEEAKQLCLGRKSCDSATSVLRTGSCDHCGAKGWDVLG